MTAHGAPEKKTHDPNLNLAQIVARVLNLVTSPGTGVVFDSTHVPNYMAELSPQQDIFASILIEILNVERTSTRTSGTAVQPELAASTRAH